MNTSSLLTEFFLLIRYGIIGVSAILIQIVALYIWVSLLGFHAWYLLGVVIGFVIALVFAFLMQKYWTFKDHDPTTRTRQFLIYTGVSVGTLVLNVLLLALTKALFESWSVAFFEAWYLVAQVLILGLCAVVSFVVNRFITFRKVVDPS